MRSILIGFQALLVKSFLAILLKRTWSHWRRRQACCRNVQPWSNTLWDSRRNTGPRGSSSIYCVHAVHCDEFLRDEYRNVNCKNPEQELFHFSFFPVLAIFIEARMARTSMLGRKAPDVLLELCVLIIIGIHLVCNKMLSCFVHATVAGFLITNAVSGLLRCKYS